MGASNRSIERGLATLAVVVSALLGLAYAYSYNRIRLSPSAVGLSPADLLLDAAAGLGFLALVVVIPMAVLVAIHTATLGTQPRSSPVTRGDAPAIGGIVVAGLVLAFLLRDVPEHVVNVAVPLLVGALIACILVTAIRSSPRLERGVGRSCRQAIFDVSFAEYAALVSLVAGAAAVPSVMEGGANALIAGEVAAGAFALAVLLFVQARRWSRRFRRKIAYERGRLMGVRASVASLVVVGFWMLLATYSDTLHYAGRLERHGELSRSLPARLRTSAITCVRLQWLGDDEPPIPGHALHVGQAGGIAVFFVPNEGPLRLPATRVALLPAPAERCHVG